MEPSSNGRTLPRSNEHSSKLEFDVQRKRTEEALKKLSSVNKETPSSVWYESGTDFCYYAVAQEACRDVSSKLKKLRLSEDETKMLATAKAVDVLCDKIREIQDAEEKVLQAKSSTSKKASKFCNNFADFAARVSGIVQLLLPQSAEYTVTFGLLAILFMAVVTKRERSDELDGIIVEISDNLPLASYYRDAFPTNAMKSVVATLYVEVLCFLDEAVIYYRSGRLGKLVDAVIQPVQARFQARADSIKRYVDKMNGLREAGLVAKISDIKDTVEETGRVVAKLYTNFESASSGINSSMAMMNRKMDAIHTKTNRFIEFETCRYALVLRMAILPSMLDPDSDLEHALSLPAPELSPKDRWENNGVLETLSAWADDQRRSLLWIGGSSGRREPWWLTELSLDMIRAFKSQTPTILYALCRTVEQPFSPRSLLRHLIAQLFAFRPDLAVANPMTCNEHVLGAVESFRDLWNVFFVLAHQVESLFILIDRVELCKRDEVSNLTHDLLPSLMTLTGKQGQIAVILTSENEPTEELEEGNLTSVYIDTAKRIAPRELW